MTERERFENLKERAKDDLVIDPTILDAMWDMQLAEIPEIYEKNTWYRYTPNGKICSNGEPYHGSLRVGTENKLMVAFGSGGVSLNEFTAARPIRLFQNPEDVGFYSDDVFLIGDMVGREGLLSDKEPNPFKNWSVLFVPYASGDFHCGTNEFFYHDEEKGDGVLYHHGFANYRAIIEKMKELVPSPDKLFVTGSSAGGFGAALLTDDIMDIYGDCNDVICFPDGCVAMVDDWHKIAETVWKTPKEISERLITSDLTTDSLVALHKKRGDKVKIVFGCSHRDAALSDYQGYVDGKGRGYNKKAGDRFKEVLKNAVTRMRKEIPNIGLYIYNAPFEGAEQLELTQHCFSATPSVFTLNMDGVRAIDWLMDCMEGKSRQIGLHLIEL